VKLVIKDILECDRSQIMCVRDIRNEPSVRSAMYTDHVIEEAEHLNYIGQLKNDPRNKVFAILNESMQPIGVTSFNSIDRKHSRCDLAFYIASKARGIGSAIEWAMLEYTFTSMGMEKLNCEVIETNTRVVELHKAFGFKVEGFRRENILKNNVRIGVFLLGLTKFDWFTNREDIYKKFGRMVRTNPVDIVG